MMKQRTLKHAIKAKGIGVHSASKGCITLRPAPVDTGIVFRRVDLNSSSTEIRALTENIGETTLSSCLIKDDVRVATIEHLMAAFYGLRIDNAYVDIDVSEVPIMDGSSEPFTFLIKSAGIKEQEAERKFLKVKKEVGVIHGDKWAKISPHNGFKISVTIDYNHPVLRTCPQMISVDFAQISFVKGISRARTFGMLSDYEYLRTNNLALGSSLDNAVVIDDFKIINEEGLRYKDEFIRHKILDAIGDLYLVGYSIVGEFSAYKPGHHINNLVLRKLLADKDAWEIISYEDEDF